MLGFQSVKMRHNTRLNFYLLILLVIASCKPEDNTLQKVEGELAGGDATVYNNTSSAFATPAPNLTDAHTEQHLVGDALFEVSFVSSPSIKNGGLGPAFNNNSCIACHPDDGRAAHPTNINEMSGLFYKISLPGRALNNGPLPVPGFGTQMQHQSLYGYDAEAKMAATYQEVPVTLADGTVVYLRKPTYSIVDPYIEMPVNVLISPRIGMPVFGLGLLEAIPEMDVLALADEMDNNKDSISGKPNYVWNEIDQTMSLGRFGWKGGHATVLLQSAGAYNEDMGITNPIFSVESTHGQSNGDPSAISPEVPMEDLEDVAFYSRTLGVPAARNLDDAVVIKGREVFDRINCASCHNPSFTTGSDYEIVEYRNQKIYPYTDMLLHDMGEELADNREEFDANGREWKTRPLWGIGLTKVTSGHTTFLHDGRARNIMEAILWHGGEAEPSRDDFKALSTNDREAILKFLDAL